MSSLTSTAHGGGASQKLPGVSQDEGRINDALLMAASALSGSDGHDHGTDAQPATQDLNVSRCVHKSQKQRVAVKPTVASRGSAKPSSTSPPSPAAAAKKPLPSASFRAKVQAFVDRRARGKRAASNRLRHSGKKRKALSLTHLRPEEVPPNETEVERKRRKDRVNARRKRVRNAIIEDYYTEEFQRLTRENDVMRNENEQLQTEIDSVRAGLLSRKSSLSSVPNKEELPIELPDPAQEASLGGCAKQQQKEHHYDRPSSCDSEKQQQQQQQHQQQKEEEEMPPLGGTQAPAKGSSPVALPLPVGPSVFDPGAHCTRRNDNNNNHDGPPFMVAMPASGTLSTTTQTMIHREPPIASTKTGPNPLAHPNIHQPRLSEPAANAVATAIQNSAVSVQHGVATSNQTKSNASGQPSTTSSSSTNQPLLGEEELLLVIALVLTLQNQINQSTSMTKTQATTEAKMPVDDADDGIPRTTDSGMLFNSDNTNLLGSILQLLQAQQQGQHQQVSGPQPPPPATPQIATTQTSQQLLQVPPPPSSLAIVPTTAQSHDVQVCLANTGASAIHSTNIASPVSGPSIGGIMCTEAPWLVSQSAVSPQPQWLPEPPATTNGLHVPPSHSIALPFPVATSDSITMQPQPNTVPSPPTSPKPTTATVDPQAVLVNLACNLLQADQPAPTELAHQLLRAMSSSSNSGSSTTTYCSIGC